MGSPICSASPDAVFFVANAASQLQLVRLVGGNELHKL